MKGNVGLPGWWGATRCVSPWVCQLAPLLLGCLNTAGARAFPCSQLPSAPEPPLAEWDPPCPGGYIPWGVESHSHGWWTRGTDSPNLKVCGVSPAESSWWDHRLMLLSS